MKLTAKLWIGLIVLIALSPLGLLLPDRFKAGEAWGEWGVERVKGLVGYIPQGLEKLSSLWKAPMPDYAFRGWDNKSLAELSFAYIISAIAGICLVVLLAFLLGKLLSAKEGAGAKK